MDPQRVLDFWFGAPDSPEYLKTRDVWFRKSDAFDQEVRERFLPVYEAAAGGELESWQTGPLSLLALIIVLDQFPRNMFRDDERALAADAMALAAAHRMVEHGWDLDLQPVERGFVYMPFQHSEDVAHQERSMALFGRLATDTASDESLKWARMHYDVIKRFGRFPHRNAVLGRQSTPEEIEFLKQPGSVF